MMIGDVFKLVFPDKCILCGELLKKGELDLCGRCRNDTPEYDRWGQKIQHVSDMTAVWFYEGDVRESILRYKFRGRRSYAPGYGRAVAMRISRDLPLPDVVTWVPVSKKRLKERGYDQVELLARAVSRELGVPCAGCLEKIRDNRPNSSLESAEARRENVRGVYRAADGAQVSEKRVLLIDDVVTTGSTAAECAGVLRQAGANDVMCAAVAAGRKTK